MRREARLRIIASGSLLVLSIAVLAAGLYATVVRFGGTYVDLGGHGTYRTDRYALITDSTNWRDQFFGWAGSVRLVLEPSKDTPIFVGVAASHTVDDYLADVSHTSIDSHLDRDEHDGQAPSAPPATSVDWTAHAEGSGPQTLQWDATDEPQTVLAMNSDGTRSVDVRVVSSATTLDRMPWWLPIGSLVAGGVALTTGGRLLRSGLRTRRSVA